MSAQAPQAVFKDDFEDAAHSLKWQTWLGEEFPGARGSFSVSPEARHTGKKGGAISFDFSKGGGYTETYFLVPDGPDFSELRFWVKKTTGNRLTVRCVDSQGQTFQKSFEFSYPGWQEVAVRFDNWAAHWGGANDGVFRGRLTRFGLIVENSAERTGKVLLDDVRALAAAPSSVAATVSDYTVFTFAGSEPWGTAGDGTWQDGTLSYNFSKGSGTDGIQTDVAVMGIPRSISLRLVGDGSAHKVRLRLGSHFQTFDKVIGTLDARGEQTLTATLGAMNGWRHYGGEDDGIPLMPLRVTGILLDRNPAGPQQGSIRLLEMKANTEIDPAEAVILVPHADVKASQAVFRCELHSLLPSAARGVLSWTVHDWSGAQVAAGKEDLAIAQGASAVREVRADLKGLPYLECRFRYTVDGRVFGPALACATAPLADAGDPTLHPESPFGMGLYLYRYPGIEPGFKLMDQAAAMGQAAGVKWSREEFLWNVVEPEKGRFDWSFYDRVVDTAQRHGVSVYGLIDYWSTWTKPYTREGIEDYTRYCKALVGHYKDRIKHWEIWNEPNIFFWSGPKELYPELLKAAYAAIKEADPEAKVLGCSTAGIDGAFIQKVTDAGAPFDILTVHPYRGSLADEGFIKELQDTARLTARRDGRQKPVWITEMGWPTHLYGGVSEPEQARLLSRSYLCAVAADVGMNMSWYNFRDDGNNVFYNEHRFGVVRSDDLGPKPGYRALATICRGLAGKKLAGRVDLGRGVLAYLFRGRDGDVAAVWSPAGDRLAAAHVTGEGLTLVDLMGHPSQPVMEAGVCLLPLRSGTPVLLKGRNLAMKRAASPMELEVPTGVHPGETVTVSLRAQEAMGVCSVRVDAPAGWKTGTEPPVSARSGRSVRVDVPHAVPEGRYELMLVLGLKQRQLRVPVTVNVVNALIRV